MHAGAAGGTLVSAAVVEACRGRHFEDAGELSLKGFAALVHAWLR